MDKRNTSGSAKDITETRNSIQNIEVRVLRSRAAKKPPAGDSVDTLVKPTAKRIRRKRTTESGPEDELSRIRKQIKYFCTRISYHQTFLEVYASEGWKNQSMEKIRPEKELERAKADIVRYKLRIREALQNLDHLLTVGKPDESLFDSEGKISLDDIVCATCSLQEDTPNNDIIFCDGACDRGFHQNCLNPPLLTKDIPEEEWLCPACDCKIYCIELIKKFQETDLSINDSWEKVFPETAAMAHGPMQNDVPDLPLDDSEDDDFDPNISEEHVAGRPVEGSSEEDGDEGSDSDDSNFITSSDNSEHVKEKEKVDDLGLPSEDSEDDDYDPAGPDSDKDIEEKQDESDFTSDSDDFCADITKSCDKDNASSGPEVGACTNDLEGPRVRPNTSMSHLTTKDLEIDQDAILPSRRRQVKQLDYKKLYDDAYGEAPSDSSDGEEWSGKRTLKEDSEERNEVDSFVHKSSRGTRAVHPDGLHDLVNDQHAAGLTSDLEVDQYVCLPVSARQHVQSPESKKVYAAYGKAPSDSSYGEDLSKKDTPETEYTPQRSQQSLYCSVNRQHTEELVTPNGSSTTRQKRHYGPIINQRLHEQFKTDQYPSRAVKERLAQELVLTLRQVEKWFENRRCHIKKTSNKNSTPIENHSTKETMVENSNVCKSDAVNEDTPSGILIEGITQDGPLKQVIGVGLRTESIETSQRYKTNYVRLRKGESSSENHRKNNSSSSAGRPKGSDPEYAVLVLEAVAEKTRNKMQQELKKRKIG